MSVPGLYCFRGGDPYSCASGSRFVGCCDIEPCSSGCPADYLHPASFEAAQLGTFSAQQCGSTSAAFYECINPQASNDTMDINEDTFWGCCLNDACADADCSDLALDETFLSSNTTYAAPYIGLNDTLENYYSSSKYAYPSTSSIAAYLSTSISAPQSATVVAASTTSITSSTTSRFLTANATVSTFSAPLSSASPSRVHVGGGGSKDLSAAIGGSVGGLAVLGALALGLLYLLRRRPVPPSPVTTSAAAAAEHPAYEKPPNLVEPGEPGCTEEEPCTMLILGDAGLQSSSQQQNHHAPSDSAAISQRSWTQVPASYFGEQDSQHIAYELPAPLEAEMNSGQRYHPYRAS